jgi:pilus assembly protein CpaB
MNRRRVLGVGAAVVLAGLGSAGVISWAESSKNHAEAQQAQTAVLIMDKRVPEGADAATILAASHVSTIQQKNLAEGALTSEDQVGTQVALADLEPGDQLVKARLGAETPGAPADKVQLSAILSAERAVGGQLKVGDTVGVYLSFEPFDTNRPQSDTESPAKTPNTTHLEFEHVQVTAIQSTQDPVSTDENQPINQVASTNFIVTLALTPAQSERFVFAAEFGHIWLSSEPATVKDDGTGIITMGNVYSVVAP